MTPPKIREWLRRYIPAEVLGTVGAVLAAWLTYGHTHSYAAGAASGWVGEGIGFYGYFIILELLLGNRQHYEQRLFKRTLLAIKTASTNLVIEFAPAELLDNFFIRPYLMFLVPHYIKPYAVGFLLAKFAADIIFYVIAVAGYEARKRWRKRP